MAKQAGLGDQFLIDGTDLSGDTASLGSIHGGPAPIDVTAINKSAYERLGGLRDGGMSWVSYFNPAGAHPKLSALPTADVIASYFRGTAAGGPAASLNAKQVNYDPTRDQAGALTFAVDAQANSFGLEWGKCLTGNGTTELRTDGTATTGAFFDDTAGTAFGGQAYFHLIAFSGTSVTIDIQSATTSGGAYSTTGLTSSALTTPGAQRVAVANTTTINEFLKVVTTGTFTNAVFAVVFVRNLTAGVVF
jgi:hypothetical protein